MAMSSNRDWVVYVLSSNLGVAAIRFPVKRGHFVVSNGETGDQCLTGVVGVWMRGWCGRPTINFFAALDGASMRNGWALLLTGNRIVCTASMHVPESIRFLRSTTYFFSEA